MRQSRREGMQDACEFGWGNKWESELSVQEVYQRNLHQPRPQHKKVLSRLRSCRVPQDPKNQGPSRAGFIDLSTGSWGHLSSPWSMRVLQCSNGAYEATAVAGTYLQ
jgi:hypothetical protein